MTVATCASGTTCLDKTWIPLTSILEHRWQDRWRESGTWQVKRRWLGFFSWFSVGVWTYLQIACFNLNFSLVGFKGKLKSIGNYYVEGISLFTCFSNANVTCETEPRTLHYDRLCVSIKYLTTVSSRNSSFGFPSNSRVGALGNIDLLYSTTKAVNTLVTEGL